MEVPRRQLEKVVKDLRLHPESHTIEHYAKAIVSNESGKEEGEYLANEFRYAGKTATRLYYPTAIFYDSLTPLNSILFVKHLLTEKYGSRVFSNGLRVEPGEKPQLFKVDEYEGRLYLSFIFLGPERRVFRNYEVIKERPQNIDYLVLHFDPFMVQVRVANGKEGPFLGEIENIISGRNRLEWVNITELNDLEAQKLKNDLNGQLIGAKHKTIEGEIVDTIEYRAKPNKNLDDAEEYQQNCSDKPYRNLTFKFPYMYNNGMEEGISLRISKNGINFYTTVSEQVIQYVLEKIIQIKQTGVYIEREAEVIDEAVVSELKS